MTAASVSQVFDLFLVHAEVVGDLMQEREADLSAELNGIGEITQQRLGKDRDFVG